MQQEPGHWELLRYVNRCLLEWHRGKLRNKHLGFAKVCDSDKPVGVGHQNDGNRSKLLIVQLWRSEKI